MKYNNPVVKGFYPDPSVCKAGRKYYLVCSTMQYYPGVPVFESNDLVNWKIVNYCLTKESQMKLDKCRSSGGIFAPTIRYYNGRFYVAVNNNSTDENFYVYTDDIYGEWSDPIYVNMNGIDPSLYFEDGRAYFMSNGCDDDDVSGIIQCEIDIKTGEKLTKSKAIWQGSGGRYLEGPHMYKINGWYYLMAAEGGTEYGHMVTYARSESLNGPFEGYNKNPVLTNRNLGGYEIQGVGHGDLIQDEDNNWWMVHLGFRQIDRWFQFHHLGRETFLSPVKFNDDGWFEAGYKGTALDSFNLENINREVVQEEKKIYTFQDTDWKKDWCYLRLPHFENYDLKEDSIRLKGTKISIDEADSPTFIGIRQSDFNVEISCEVTLGEGQAGISIYMDENHHYDLLLSKEDESYRVIERLNIGDIKFTENYFKLGNKNSAVLMIKGNNIEYSFYVKQGDEEIFLGKANNRYLSSEVAGGFTGVVIGLYCYGDTDNSYGEFRKFKCEYL